MSTPTLSDVAARARVSTAAASLALNGKPGVSESTRERVFGAAKHLGYRPNPVGRALRQARIGSIGLYLPGTAGQFSYYAEVTNGITEVLHRRGTSLLFLPNSANGLQIERAPLLDGYILIEPHSDDPGVAEILAQDLPVVTGDRPKSGLGDPWGIVESPTRELTRDSLEHLRERGSKRPGILVIERVSEWTLDLEQYYLEWCAEHSITPRIATVSINDSNEELVATLAPFFTAGTGCDGLFTAGDGIAARIAGILRTLGKTVGKDVKLVSGVDSDLMSFHTPSITAIDLQPRLFGSTCAELMLELLDGGHRPATLARRLVPAPLIARDSA